MATTTDTTTPACDVCGQPGRHLFVANDRPAASVLEDDRLPTGKAACPAHERQVVGKGLTPARHPAADHTLNCWRRGATCGGRCMD